CGYTDMRLESGEFAALMTGSIRNEAKAGIQYRKTGVISGFAAKRLRSFDFSESGIVTLSYDEKAAEVSPGDWRSFAGYDFSGSCEYVCRLTMPEDAKTGGMIDLGKVCYASEILLDGHPLGTRLMPPYRFEVPAGYLTAGDHELRITVTNTPANRYMGTDFFDRYEEWQLSPYFPKEKTYYPDTAESGLFGPVTVTYE
ncbi:MAG: hypothetical protein K6D94_03995, partial [Clostridiales bacterium]|nr:hypothetical protein [Clostridiales bacterium]